MDVCTPTSPSVSKDLTYFAKLCTDPLESTCEVLGHSSINEVGDSLTNLLSIRDDNKVVPINSLNSARNGVGKKDFCKEALPTPPTTVTSEKSLSKSATFPSSSMTTFPAAAVVEGEPKDQSAITTAEELSQNDNHKSVTPPCQHSVSLPTPSKLVSAMKGSREKQGILPKMMSVMWAPDVYDPIPTAVSHVPTNKPLKYHKNSKNKQKGSNRTSSGSKSKLREKKKAQKHCRSSSRGLKIPNQGKKMVEFEVGQKDFVIGNPDAYCGASFLKKSIARLHFSIAEAS